MTNRKTRNGASREKITKDREKKSLTIKGLAIFQVVLLASMTFTIAFFMSEYVGVASAAAPVVATAPSGIIGPLLGKAGVQGFTKGAMAGQFTSTGWVVGPLAYAVSYAVVGYGIGQLIGMVFGLAKETTSALSTSLAVGGAVFGALYGIQTMMLAAQTAAVAAGTAAGGAAAGAAAGSTGMFSGGLITWSGLQMFGVGLAIAAVVFILTFKKVKYIEYTANCQPWEAPVGGARCEDCNKDALRLCSEYRCKALGQACSLVNAGTTEEKCVWISPNDVTAPKIQPWNDALSPTGLKYTDTQLSPPSPGTKIVKTDGSCLAAFTPLVFGITLDEPAKCKIDFNHTTKFDDMQYYLGGSNYLRYNHTEIFSLPGAGADGTFSGPIIRNDGTMDLYIRCQDANGNSNEAEFAVKFCVSAAPDTTPPLIEKTSIISGSFVGYQSDSTALDVFTNEPANCKWSKEDKDYSLMENDFTCVSDASEINADLTYTCSGNITGLEDRVENKYYFACEDTKGNKMVERYPFILKGSQPLYIKSISPNGTIIGSSTVVSFDLNVETKDGAEEGVAGCLFSKTGNANDYTIMFETYNFVHKQLLQHEAGDYTYFVKCVDAGGNIATNKTDFTIFVDKDSPLVTRAYKEEPSTLKIVTNEDATCAYSTTSCNFAFEDGTPMTNQPSLGDKFHFVAWKANEVYHIKCRDKYGNQPSPNDCSIIAGVSLLS